MRAIRAALSQGATPGGIAAVSSAASPYLLLLHERLTAAAVPHWGSIPISTRREDRPDHLDVGEVGTGVFIGKPDHLSDDPHELVVVLGLVEGSHPGPDALVALGRARRVVLSVPRVDTRAGREVAPSRWWLGELGKVTGRRLHASTLGEVEHPALRDIPSFQEGLESATAYADRSEATAAQLLSLARTAGPRAAAEAFASVDPRSARAVTARDDRALGRASPWTGFVGPLPDGAPGRVGSSPVGSPTRFERWASCPQRFFLSYVLGVEEPDEPEAGQALSDRDRGSLVHEVLERFHGAELARRDPGEPFTAADMERLEEVVGEVTQLYREAGGDESPLLWDLEGGSIVRRLEAALAADAAHRSSRDVVPVVVEHSFGFEDGPPPVRVELPDGRSVAFRGKVDRIDASAGGERVVVIDYKTGSDRDYTSLPKPGRGRAADITCNGRHLQLAVYAEAARQLLGNESEAGSEEVEAYYWFLDGKSSASLRGGPVGHDERERLREVLGGIVEGIDAGHFPANPGEEGWFGPDNCRRCPFDHLCPPSRVDRWEALHGAPEVASYVVMAEGER